MARKTTTVDYLWGKNIGEGAFARVVHAKRKIAPGATVEAIKSSGDRSPGVIVSVSESSPPMIEVKFTDDSVETLDESSVFPDHLAVKIMEKMHIMKNDKVEYVKQEKNFLAKLSGSRWIIKLLNSFQDKDNVYMVMPLAHGGMLHGLIQKRKDEAKALNKVDFAMDAKEAQFYVAEIVVALRFLHKQNIVHRDLKPENILVMANGHLKLTDFGTALDTTAGEGVKDFVGTPEFVSPEVLKDEPATTAADMWGLGVIIFQILTGRMPFTANSEWLIFEVILEHCSGAKPLSCPPNAADAVGVAAGEDVSATENCATNTSGEMILGLLKPDVADRWTMDQVVEHFFLASFSLEDDAMAALTPPWVPGVNESLAADACVEFSQDWLFEHEHEEATPMEVGTGPSEPLAAAEAPAASPAAAVERDTVLDVKWGAPNENESAGEFKSLLGASEKVLFSGPTWKRKGLFSKNRVLIFTNKPRLIYVDPAAGNELKGEIPWTKEQPVSVVVIDNTHFDIVSPADGGRAYHFMSTEKNADPTKWVEVINDFMAKGRPTMPKPRSAMALFGSVTDE